MTSEQPLSSATSTSRRRRPILTIPAATVMVLILSLLALQYAVFPRGSYFRELIANADRLELQAFLENSERDPLICAVVTDPEAIAAVAESVKLRGVWEPFDELIGNSYRIRAVTGEETADIVIRGGDRLKHGNWYVRVSPALMDTFVQVVEESGGRMPSLRDLRGAPE